MAKSAAEQFTKLQEKLASSLRTLPAIIGEEVVNFSLLSFEQEAWSGNNQEVWPKRKNPNKWGKPDETDRALLVKSGKLKRSIRVTRIVNNTVWVGAGGVDIPYARVHNYGFRGRVDQNVREHTRTNKKTGGKINVKAFERVINQNIPKRQFIGAEADSPYLKARLRRMSAAEIRKIFK
ncbi:phage virion morphogenesis protein [Flavobacterium sp. HSC-61S13]|uniref:phage virion morphogenesis protein n=1 Tax=Flavobacterium sp. HSC-61S13 TaxID=2910963 RepID=UPI00209DEEED|nr:phage virion morphogenesis protein [Flavobacterium sp. HSC-61S13]MCP1997287.1 phage gpG-like protein [Flavobacterium sp. HSC-61S13]